MQKVKIANNIDHRIGSSGLMFGQGCKFYHDCFTCPFEDCRWSSDRDSLKHERTK
jgi:hypothetical protein